jgi:hypothetical protein
MPPYGSSWEAVCFTTIIPGEPSGILGVAVDGFPIYGPYDANGVELTPFDLDDCNGMEVDGQYRYIATGEFPYGPGCLWGTASADVDDDLCWVAKDYLNIMELTDFTLYSDCQKDPYSQANGTAGCISFYSNPALYLAKEKGTMADFNAEYIATCGAPDSMYENASPAEVTEESTGTSVSDSDDSEKNDSSLGSLAGGAFMMLSFYALYSFVSSRVFSVSSIEGAGEV